ncbi:FAD-binding oxidoreductase [Halegenticoccus tardaugens]|uniref:FAD-binding oxidoreductase n=1 Tax=Halegenticoccus tardaugens TaxID=2071624 RepID=UPI00100AA552|nr:FAD-binding oxidoreductase [Halegenticoccus tardaugens]
MATRRAGERGGELNETAVARLRSRFKGELLRPEDPGYEEARAVWNGMIDRRPALVARCRGVADVIEAVDFGRDEGVEIAVRGGGHNVAGNAVCDDGLAIDLSEMNDVRVDLSTRTVRAGGGATWADVDRETQLFGLATPGGVVSDTGIAGLTLGGGLGHLRRKYGLSCDNLVSVDLVTPDGMFLTASEDEYEDLFWALRGGGGNFGVVTSFEYRLHPVGPEVAGCFVFHPGDEATEGLRFFREYAASAPEEVSVLAFFAFVPDDPTFPEAARGEFALAFLGCYAGPVGEGTDALRPLREFATPLADLSGPMAYTDLQSMLDEDYPEGMEYYWKSQYVDDLSDEIVAQLRDAAATAPSTLSTVDVWQLGGAIDRIGPDESAFGNRGAPYLVTFEANWERPEDREANVRWARDGLAALRRHTSRGAYVNFPGFGEEGEALVRAAYGDNYDRLVEVKSTYDPENAFHLNQNVVPNA